jgi:hypothetical protein
MARTGFVLLLLVSAIVSLRAQTPNDWINFNQAYYKIPVAKDGIYRLTFLQLQQSGFPVESLDPRFMQIFHRGVEQSILVEGEGDEQFNPTDYIEFYGQKNDGTRDSKLYGDPAQQPHTYYNLYSDTTSYFLTIGTAQGKRMSSSFETDTDSRTPQSYVLQEKLMIMADDYSVGTVEEADVYSSNFDTGEGWTGYLIYQGFSRDYIVDGISKTVTSAPPPALELTLTGRNDGEHTVRIYVGQSFRPLSTHVVNGFEPLKIFEAIEWADITADGKLPIRVAVDNLGKADYIGLCAIKLSYARAPDAAGAPLLISTIPDISGKILLNIIDPEAGATIFDITDPANARVIGSVSTASSLSALIPDADVARTLYVATSHLEPAKITPIKFRSFVPGQADYIIISHPAFRKPAMEYADPVKAYAEYRASDIGGGYDTLIVHSRDLYDQFNYGEVSSLAIHEFLRYVSQTKLPAHIFIIGKGLELTYRYHRTAFVPGEYQDYVPPAGFPGSDILYSVGIGGTGYTGGISTGRLTATKPEHVAAYLNKVKETEALPFDDLWRKRILHLSGGIETWEPLIFKNHLEVLQGIAEKPHMGASVSAIAKQSRDVQIINVSEQVNQGVGLITFLGHSSTGGLDFELGYVTNTSLGYKNGGRYPMMIMNGCETGAFFYKFRHFGEDWILADKLGSTGFIAHNSYGTVQRLMGYSRQIYQVAFNDENYIGKGVGDIKLEAGKRYLQAQNPTGPDFSQVQQMILLGDPALPLFGARKPDLEAKQANLSIVSLDNKPITATYDSFGIRLMIRNYGIVKPQLFKLQIERTLADNSVMTYDSLIQVPSFTDTVVFIIRRRKEIPFGTNHFRITLDPDDILDELNENNNVSEIDYVFQLNGTKNLYPADYAIATTLNPQLTFQATDVYSDRRDFVLELDSVSTFDSPFKKQYSVNGKVLGMQAVELAAGDTVAYYWRTRLADPSPAENPDWTVSSFTYIRDGGEGWAQVHFPQLANNASVGLVKDTESRRIYFEKSVLPVKVNVFDAALNKPIESTSVLLDETEYNMSTLGWGCRTNTINLIAFDRKSTYPYIGVDMKWYEVWYVYRRWMICGRQPFVINNFQSDEVSADGRPDMIDYVNNIHEGDSVLLFTIGNAGINLWPEDAKNKLSEFGISSGQLASLNAGEGVVIFGRKGAPAGSAKLLRTSESTDGSLSVEKTITGGYTSGQLNAQVGPASSWQKIAWAVSEKESQDNIGFNVYGIKATGGEELILQSVSSDQDISGIDAGVYPNLRIEFYTEDNTLLTPAQLRNWIVHFTPVPEGVLLPFDSSEVLTLQEGEIHPRQFGFYNVSDKTFDGDLQVRYSLFNTDQQDGTTLTQTIAAPLPGDTTTFTVTPSTTGFGGWNDFEVFVNPRIVPERQYDNNIIQLRSNVFVVVDEASPLTDVTFDGRHIKSGDFVPHRPKIRITMWDNNAYLLKQDTAGVKVFLKAPCASGACDPVYIPFSSPDMKWFAATTEQDFYIDFTPTLTAGEYTLIVEAADARGNKAAQPFEIFFIVDDEVELVFTEPYPNPCATDLNYGLKLSGNESAHDFIFEVRDLTGRNLFQREVASVIPVGNHEFFWSGTDNNGNLLSAGVYLITYRVTLSGVEYQHQTKVVLVH